MNLLPGAEIYCPLSVLERVRIRVVFFFKENIGEFFRDMETVRNIERCRYREVRLYN